jgi:hypothetical protein
MVGLVSETWTRNGQKCRFVFTTKSATPRPELALSDMDEEDITPT